MALLVGRGTTPPIRGPDSVAELREVGLGGDLQWVLLRGRRSCNPVVLFLHGGPGMPAMYLAHDFQRSWEEHLTVVHWDRLGAGKSYGAGLTQDSFTVRRTLDDTHALSEWLRERFGVPGVVLVGHSWGSYLGMLAVAERPELYAAYVGTGQLAGTREERARARAAMLRPRAEAAGDTALLLRLDAGEAIPEEDLFRYGGELVGSTSFLPILRTGLRAREYTVSDVVNVGRGASRVSALMFGDEAPLGDRVESVEVPVYFFLGRHDMNTPAAVAAAYLKRLRAPRKELVWFERSAHFPFWEEPEAFGAALLEVAADIPRADGCSPP